MKSIQVTFHVKNGWEVTSEHTTECAGILLAVEVSCNDKLSLEKYVRGFGQRTLRKTTVGYPIITVRWLAIHALAIPTVFFIGAITSMQFM